MINELLKKYDETMRDMKINGFKNLETNKIELSKITEECFVNVGIKETSRIYQNYVRNYK